MAGPLIRVTQVARENLASSATPPARVTQTSREVFSASATPPVCVTQVAREVLISLRKDISDFFQHF